jgi:hypothetical protein
VSVKFSKLHGSPGVSGKTHLLTRIEDELARSSKIAIAKSLAVDKRRTSLPSLIEAMFSDIPQMAGPSGRLGGGLPAVRRPSQPRKCRDGARGQRHRPVIAVRPEILLGRATNERSSPADSQRRQ